MLLAPAQRRRPDAICFCFVAVFRRRRKTCVCKLSTNDNITLSPAYGGRKKQNRESGQLQRLVPQKQIGRTFQGKTACFPPLAISQNKKLTPITLFRKNLRSAAVGGRELFFYAIIYNSPPAFGGRAVIAGCCREKRDSCL